jgi:hypothetical protein
MGLPILLSAPGGPLHLAREVTRRLIGTRRSDPFTLSRNSQSDAVVQTADSQRHTGVPDGSQHTFLHVRVLLQLICSASRLKLRQHTSSVPIV